MINWLKSPNFQLKFSVFLLVASVVLIPLAYMLHLMESVAFVSALSILALVLAALSGVISALVYKDQNEGYTLNTKDKQYLENLLDRKLRAGDKPVHSEKEQTSSNGLAAG